MVGFDECRKVGEHATSGVTSNFENTVTGMKRLIGLAFDDPRAQREMELQPGLKFVPVSHTTGPPSVGVKVMLGGEETVVAIEAIFGMMVKHLGEIAAGKAQESDPSLPLDKLMPQDWVIAIPNYFTDSQRRAVLTGCDFVGIGGVQRLMHETTATALAYGIFKDLRKEFTKETPANVMFIDMGASAYTVSIAVFEPGKLIVKSAHCDPNLGGRDFDLLIAQYISDKFSEKFKGKLSADPMSKAKTRIKLLAAAEKAKKTLSPVGVKEARIDLEMLQDDYDFHSSLNSTDYEAMCEPLLDRLAAPIEAALAEVKLTNSDLTSVEIVGGSTRIGCIKRKLTEILNGATLSTTMNADESVARGAALQSAILSPRFKVLPYEIVEAQPYPVKISWEDAENKGMEVDNASGETTPTDSVVMFDRGISFPIVRRVTLRRAGEFTVKAVYDDACKQYGVPAAAGKDIAEFTIKAPVGGEDKKVRVNVKEDIHGIIQLSSAQMVEEIEEEPLEAEAKEAGDEKAEEKKKKIKKTNLECSTVRPLDWTAEEINKAYEAEVAMANTDRVVRETADMRNELESYIYVMRDKIVSDSHLGPYGTEDEKAAFSAKNESMENWLYEDGFDAHKSVYAEKLADLKALGEPLEKRQAEAEGRAAAISNLKSTLELYQNWANDAQTNEAYSHITDEERGKVCATTDATSGWLYEMLDKQGGLAPNQDPVLMIADVNKKIHELNTVCGPIMRKPKPKPAKEVPKPDETKKEETANGNGDSDKKSSEDGAPMDVDADGATPMET
jgi:heat shock 70kDa protein 4